MTQAKQQCFPYHHEKHPLLLSIKSGRIKWGPFYNDSNNNNNNNNNNNINNNNNNERSEARSLLNLVEREARTCTVGDSQKDCKVSVIVSLLKLH